MSVCQPGRSGPALARHRHALGAAIGGSLGLIGPSRNTTGQSTLRCPARREITSAPSGLRSACAATAEERAAAADQTGEGHGVGGGFGHGNRRGETKAVKLQEPDHSIACEAIS